jgi:hypothetical protein
LILYAHNHLVQVKENKIHGKGKYIDAQGNIYEGKFKYGFFRTKIDKKTRNVIKLKPKTGQEISNEIKSSGSASTKWFEAVKNSSGTFEMTDKDERDMISVKAAAASSSGGC